MKLFTYAAFAGEKLGSTRGDKESNRPVPPHNATHIGLAQQSHAAKALGANSGILG